jgi:iron complex outermembrane recepter protein
VQGITSFCGQIQRDPITGQIVTLSRGNANLGQLETEGVDLNLGYRLPRTAFGQFGLRSDTTYVDTYKTRTTGDFFNYAGEYGLNRVKSNASLDWNMGNWSATWTARYYSGVKTHCWSNTATLVAECSNPNELVSWGTGYNRQGALVYNDLSIGYAFPWKGKLIAGANNVLNKKPQIVYDANSGFGGSSSSSSVNPDMPIDRFFYVRYNQAF